MLLTATRLLGRADLFGKALIGAEHDMMRSFNDAAQVVFMQ